MSKPRPKRTKRAAAPPAPPRELQPAGRSDSDARSRPRSRSRRNRVVGLALAAAAAVALAIGFLYLAPSTDPIRPLNIIIVTADTLRADRLPAYGYDRVETPNLDRMAATGVLFDNAHTVVPLTLPAHSSMFTGTFPMYHGVRDNGGYYLGDEQMTLAETLRDNGYRTGGFVAAFVLDARWGLDQGFERYFDEFDFRKYERIALDTVQRSGGEVLDEGLLWMEEVKHERFFSWLHFYDVHTPWEPPEPFASRYQGYAGASYDGEIAYVDSLMGRIFDWLEENDLTDDTMVVFIGDHGESLGQHEENTHGFFIYDATMHVPFIMRTPYRQMSGRRVEAQVRSVDLMPTVLDLVGIDPPASVQGTSLRRLAAGDAESLGLYAYGESFYPRHHYGWSELKSIRNESFHFIDAPEPELFDVRDDPRQEHNIAAQRAGTVSELKAELDGLVERFGVEGIDERAPETLDAETEQQLAALGYLGSPAKVTVDSGSPLADPKDKIGLFNLIKQAGSDSSEGDFDGAMAKIEAVLRDDPGILEAHNIMGNLLTNRGDLPAAAEAYQEALARDPEYKPALFGLALTYKELGRTEDAEAGLRRVLDLDPRDNRAAFTLASIHAERKEFGEALELLRRASDTGSERAPLHNLMAECHIGLGELDLADEQVERALALNPELPTAHYNRALILEERGDGDGAIEAYLREIEVAPEDYKAHFNLAKLYGQAGRPDRMRAHLESAIEHNASFAEGHLYLAKLHLDEGRLDEAREHAERGIELGPEPAMAPFGHFILADVYNREGRLDEAERELRAGRRLQGQPGS